MSSLGSRFFGTMAVAALFSIGGEGTSRAEDAPPLAGFSPLGQVLLDKSGCPSCPAVFATNKRHRAFGLASDSPFPVSQSGQLDVTCTSGASYHYFLRPATRGGLFQLVPNMCVNLDSKEIKLTITSVGLSPPDAERTVTLVAYGSFG
jgi:hypothetical protein